MVENAPTMSTTVTASVRSLKVSSNYLFLIYINFVFIGLPYDHCSLSLQPFRDPYITSNGVIYDLTNIVPFLQRYGVDPYSGEKLQAKQLIKLNFQKNADNKYQ